MGRSPRSASPPRRRRSPCPLPRRRLAAGFWIPHMTGWIGLVDRGQLAEGERLVVLGAAGGSGIAAVQLGHALGAHVIAVVSSEAKAEFCRGLGADDVRPHATARSPAPSASYRRSRRRRDLRPGRRRDRRGRLRRVRPRRPAARHRLRQRPVAAVPHPRFVVSNTRSWASSPAGTSRQHLDDIHAGCSDLLTAGTLRNAVTERVPFEDLPQAVQRLADRKVLGKLVLDGPTS